MKYLPTWLKTVFFLSFYPLVIALFYCLGGASCGHRDLMDALFSKEPATGRAGFMEALGDCLVIGLCAPTVWIALILCVIIHLYTYTVIERGLTEKREVDISGAAQVVITAMLIVSGISFFATTVIFG